MELTAAATNYDQRSRERWGRKESGEVTTHKDMTTDRAADVSAVGSADVGVLDHAVRSALTGPHAHFAERRGRVLRYPRDVSVFGDFPEDPTPQDWADAAELYGPGADLPVSGDLPSPPPGWAVSMNIPGVQMVGTNVWGAADAEAVVLTRADVPEMLALVGRTRPGPFLTRTIELGTYLGIRRGGELVAMAGERLHPVGWTEISAVCTDEAFRGQGLGTRLVLAVAAGIRARGDIPFLHTAAANVTAIRLYEELGFVLRRTLTFGGIRIP